MPLHWISGEAVVDEGTFVPGKLLWLEAQNSLVEVDTLQVAQVYSSAMRQILSHIGVPERRLGPVFSVRHIPPDRHRSEYQWRLPVPRGWRKSAAYVFMHEAEESPPVFSARIGKASLGLEGGAQVADPAGMLPIGVDGRAHLSATMTFAIDPEVSVEPMSGEALAEHMLRNLIDDVGHTEKGDDPDVAARIELSLSDLREALLHAYSPPAQWTVEASQLHVAGEEGDIATVELDLEAPTPGEGYFAVCFSASGEGETTDPWMIRVDADLRITAITDPSTLKLPSVAYA